MVDWSGCPNRTARQGKLNSTVDRVSCPNNTVDRASCPNITVD